MSEPTVAEGNVAQAAHWNDVGGARWVAHQDLLDAELASLGEAVIAAASLRTSDRVLDVGCGCGATSLALATQVASVVGVDVSAPMLARAAARAQAAGLDNVAFLRADAQVHAFAPGSFDVVFSRFGVMFFAEPEVAFRGLRAALAPGGRLAFVCWRGLAENPLFSVPLEAARPLLPPLPESPPGAPGPMAFADPARVHGLLAAAGFADASITPLDLRLPVAPGRPFDEAVEFLLQLGPLAAAIRESGGAASAVRGAVAEALLPFVTDTGLSMPSATWLVTARG